MKQFFAPISKINKKTREVSGILALEVKDKEGEIMDYEGSKPYFERWSKSIHKASGGKSVGNLRVMHQPIVGGKFTEITFNDDLKRIEVVSKVSNDTAWQQVLDGELNGFSIYGNYISRKKDSVAKARRYVVEPLEGSLVDNPCMYGADFTEITENGETVVRKFAGNKEPEQVWICKKENCDLYHKNKEEASSCAGVVEKSFNEDELEEDFTNNPEPVSKGMYDLTSLASSISSLKYITVDDANKEKFAKAVKALFTVLSGMVKVESKSFESYLNQLSDATNAVKSLIKGKKEKEKKMKVTELEGLEEFKTELVNEISAAVSKSVSKTVAKSAGTVIKEHIEESLEEVVDTVNTVVKTVNKFMKSGAPSKVVTKAVDRKNRESSEDDDEEEKEKTTKTIKPIKRTSDIEDPEIMKAMKAALKRPVANVDEDEGEEEGDE